MPFLKDLYNGVSNFPYYYGGMGNFSQTSLPFDKDIREGGYSGQPYIKTDIDGFPQYSQFDDGFIRGGVLNTLWSIAQDEIRLGKFLTGIGTKGNYLENGVAGPLFLLRQIGSNRTNPQFENLRDAAGSIVNPKDNKRTYNREYNLFSIPLNVLSSPFGIHFDQNGLIGGDKSYGGDLTTGVSGVAADNMTTFQNAGDITIKSNANRLVTYFDRMLQQPGNYLLSIQNGGSDSLYGIGQTKIERVRNTGPLNDATTDKNKSLTLSGGFLAFDYKQIRFFNKLFDDEFQKNREELLEKKLFPFGGNYNKDFKDFRAVKSGSYSFITASSYPVFNIENRIGVSTNVNKTYKANTDNVTNIWQTEKGNVDSINTINITDAKTFYDESFGAKTPNADIAQQNKVNNLFQNGEKYKDKLSGYFARDIIKFRIEVNNNNKVGIDSNEVLAFRAYLNTLDDDFEAKWNEYRYMGRGEPFFVYEGFTRDISLSFTVFAHTAYEMAPIWNKINYLASSLTPDYSDQGFMRGNFHYLTIGDYIYRQPGIITSLRLSNFLDHPWEIGLDSPEKGQDIDQLDMPKYFVVGMTFKPIHSFLPRRNTIDKYTAPFFTPDIVAYNGYGGVKVRKDGDKDVIQNKYLPKIETKIKPTK